MSASMPRRLLENIFHLQFQLLAAVLLCTAVAGLAQTQFIMPDGHFAAAASTLIFSDNFNAANLDANKWRRGANAGNKSSVIGNQLELRSLGAENGWVITRKAYAARNTVVQVKVARPNDDGALGISPTFNLASQSGIADQKNWYRFYVYRSGRAGPHRLFVQWKKNGVENGLDVTGNLIINGAVYLRLRFDQADIHFEASLDGATWTKTYAEPLALPGYNLDTPFYYELTGYNTAQNGVSAVDDFSITLPAPTPAMTVVSPNGGEWWFAEEKRDIKWNAATAIANVKLEFSRNAGVSWQTIIASTPNDGTYNWLVPDSVSNTNLIRISNAANANVADVSDKTFFIARRALVEFAPATNEPVLSPGPLGSWDERITERGWFMYENGMYHAWYGGWKGNYDHAIKNFVKLGYATSADGVHWTKYSGKPIYNQHWTEDMVVVKNGDTYYMYAENEYTGDGNGATTDLYTSLDKINWTRYGTVLSPGGGEWESNAVGTPTVWKEAKAWYMLYEGFGSGAGQVGLATSLDGKNWTRHSKNPVLTNFLGEHLDIAVDSIIKLDGVYYAYGHYDTGAAQWAGGMFTTTDLLKWSAYPGNPILANSTVLVDNGVNYFMYGVTSNPDGLAPYYLKFSRYRKDVVPPLISNVTTTILNGTTAKIAWKTNEMADSQVEYGLTPSYGALSPFDSTLITSHAMTLSGLQPNKTYHYRVKSRDEAGNLALSGDFSFKTPNWIFMDNFNAGSLNAGKWQRGANANNKAAVVDSALELRSQLTVSGGSESGWVITRNAYPARNTRVKIKIVKPNNDGALGLSPTYNLSAKGGINDQKNFYRFYNYRSGNTGPYRLIAQWKKNGVEGEREVTGDLVLHAGFFMRLRFDNTNIHFEASLDGAKWVDTYNVPFALPGYTLDSPFYYELSAYNTTATGVWIVDDFAVLPENSAAKSATENITLSRPPEKFSLNNYPNPFNAATRIHLALPQEAEIRLSIFDLTGRELHVLLTGTRAAGNYEMAWNGKNQRGLELGTGIYLLRLRYRTEGTGAWSQMVRRVMMIK
jgi:predicted GH43/DUF377 family glycosyl hydrolase